MGGSEEGTETRLRKCRRVAVGVTRVLIDSLTRARSLSLSAFCLRVHFMCPCVLSMTWPSNHLRLATGTMFTLFFAGRDFAPKLLVEGQNIQDFLQGHFIAAMAR